MTFLFLTRIIPTPNTQERITLPWSDAFFHVEDKSPGVDATVVLEMLKKMERVKYNDVNQVFTYEVSLCGHSPTHT